MTQPLLVVTPARAKPMSLSAILFSRASVAEKRAPRHLALVVDEASTANSAQGGACLRAFEELLAGCLETGVACLSIHLKSAGPPLPPLTKGGSTTADGEGGNTTADGKGASTTANGNGGSTTAVPEFCAALNERREALAARGVELYSPPCQGEAGGLYSPPFQGGVGGVPKRLLVNVVVNGSGRRELVDAVRRLAAAAASGKITAPEITTELMRRALVSAHFPPVDLLVSTGGGRALSDFLLWHAGYAELLFLDSPWSAFRLNDFQLAMADFSRRSRTFGALPK